MVSFIPPRSYNVRIHWPEAVVNSFLQLRSSTGVGSWSSPVPTIRVPYRWGAVNFWCSSSCPCGWSKHRQCFQCGHWRFIPFRTGYFSSTWLVHSERSSVEPRQIRSTHCRDQTAATKATSTHHHNSCWSCTQLQRERYSGWISNRLCFFFDQFISSEVKSSNYHLRAFRKIGPALSRQVAESVGRSIILSRWIIAIPSLPVQHADVYVDYSAFKIRLSDLSCASHDVSMLNPH